MVGFDQLKPIVSKPANAPYTHQLSAKAKQAIGEAIAAAAGEVRKKNLPGAIEELQRAQGFDPNNPQIHRLLGEAYLKISDFGQAYENFSLASKYLGDDVAMQLGLGRLCVIQQNYSRAIRYFRAAMLCSNAEDSNPHKAIALLFLCRLLDREGYWTAGLECYERLDKLFRKHSGDYFQHKTKSLQKVLLSPEILLAERGRLLLKLGRNLQAAEMLRRAHERNKSSVPTARLLLKVQIDNKRYAQAEDLVVSLAEQKSFAAILPALTLELCVASCNRQVPMRIWDRLNRQSSNVPPALRIALGEALIRLGSPQDARKILELLSREAPSNLQAVTLLGVLDAKDGNTIRGFERLVNLVVQTRQNPPDILSAIQKILAASEKPATDIAQEFLVATENFSDASDNKFAMYYVAGFLARQSGNKILAADCFQQAIDAKKDFYPACDELLSIRLNEGRLQQVSAILDQMKTQSRKGFYYHFVLGKVHLRQGKIDEAISELELAREKNSSHLSTLLKLSEAYHLKAARNTDTSLQQKASEMLRLGLRTDPQRADIYRRLFDSYVRCGDLPAARGVAGQAMRNMPRNPVGRILAGEVYMLAGEKNNTGRLITNLLKQYPDNAEVQLLAIRNQISEHRGVFPKKVYDSLVARLEGLINNQSNNIRARRILAQLYDRPTPGAYTRAAGIWEKLYRSHPYDVNYGKALGASLFRAGKYERVVPVARKLIGQMPKNENMRTMLAEALLKTGQVDEAIRLATKWWSLNKKSHVCTALLIKIYTESSRFADGVEFLQQLAAADSPSPFSQETLQYLEMEFLVRGKFYDRLTRLVLNSDSLDIDLSGVYLLKRAGQPGKAISLLKKMIDKLKDTDKSGGDEAEQKKNKADKELLLESYVWCLVEASRLETAAIIVKKHPVSSVFGRKLAEAFISALATKDSEKSAAALKNYHTRLIRQLKPDELTKPLRFCDDMQYGILMLQRNYAQALKLADKQLAKNPNDPVWLRARGYILSEQGKSRQAAKVIRQIYEQNPDDPESQNNYAYQLAETGTDLDKAEKLIMTSLAGSKSKTGEVPLASLDTLGWVFYKRQKPGQAAEVFEQIIERITAASTNSFVDESHPVMWDHAADVFCCLGWTKKALAYWTTALKQAKATPVDRRTRELRLILKNTPRKIRAEQK